MALHVKNCSHSPDEEAGKWFTNFFYTRRDVDTFFKIATRWRFMLKLAAAHQMKMFFATVEKSISNEGKYRGKYIFVLLKTLL